VNEHLTPDDTRQRYKSTGNERRRKQSQQRGIMNPLNGLPPDYTMSNEEESKTKPIDRHRKHNNDTVQLEACT
jgi:hypothetical protein